jgi:hypothetical protein
VAIVSIGRTTDLETRRVDRPAGGGEALAALTDALTPEAGRAPLLLVVELLSELVEEPVA